MYIYTIILYILYIIGCTLHRAQRAPIYRLCHIVTIFRNIFSRFLIKTTSLTKNIYLMKFYDDRNQLKLHRPRFSVPRPTGRDSVALPRYHAGVLSLDGFHIRTERSWERLNGEDSSSSEAASQGSAAEQQQQQQAGQGSDKYFLRPVVISKRSP